MSSRVHIALLLAALLSVITACDRIPELPSFGGEEGNPVSMIVVNEGLFTTNTAALSVIYADGTVHYDVFRAVNQRPLGDVAQSMTEINGLYFVAVNNSRRIEILDPKSFRSIGSIRYSRAGSPRYITPLTDSTAVVSDLHNQLVTIRTRPPYRELEYIELPFTSSGIEQMITVGGKVFCIYIDRGIAVFDTSKFRLSTMRLIDEVSVSWAQSTAKPVVDHRGRVWFLSTKRVDGVETPRLSCIDPVSEEVVDERLIPLKQGDRMRGDLVGMPSYNRIDIDPEGRRIYLSLLEASVDHPGKDDRPLQVVYTLDVDSKELTRYLPLPEVKLMYGMSVSPEGKVCICDCLDFTAQRGYVRVFAPGIGEEKSYKVAVYPNFVFFPKSR